jgi:hypothetical protein
MPGMNIMYRDNDNSLLLVVGTGLSVIGLCSLPALVGLFLQLSRKEKKKNEIYEDGDGKATPESVKAFSTKTPKALIVLFGLLGAAISIVLAVLSTGAEGAPVPLENWLTAGAWVSLEWALEHIH